jgi:hypothetical protein
VDFPTQAAAPEAALHLHLFKGRASARGKIQVHDFISISVAGPRPAQQRADADARFNIICHEIVRRK